MPAQTQEFIKKGVEARDLFKAEIVWEKHKNPVFPYFAMFEGVSCFIRVNDFPAETLFTLIVEGGETFDFDDWPTQWTRP